MATAATDALIKQLMTIEGKAEIIGNRIIEFPLHDEPVSQAKMAIQASLHNHAKRLGRGRVGGSPLGFVIDLADRKSFCPDVSFYDLPSAGMGFPRGAPLLAVEFGSYSGQNMTQKVADYFSAGTLVVWDVDTISEDVIRVYRASEPQNPTIFRRGQIAAAEPAVPGWSMLIDDLFA